MHCQICKNKLQFTKLGVSAGIIDAECMFADCPSYTQAKLRTNITYFDGAEEAIEYFFPVKASKTGTIWCFIKPATVRSTKYINICNRYGVIITIGYIPMYVDDRFEQSYKDITRTLCKLFR
jgi:hypothetical protein